ncbi:hypothetical protein HDU67_004743 [Dinochytrium kinnereticum]|nr:hypothetical protein HDU67_004743 [Dinochytrium kinnereticum]
MDVDGAQAVKAVSDAEAGREPTFNSITDGADMKMGNDTREAMHALNSSTNVSTTGEPDETSLAGDALALVSPIPSVSEALTASLEPSPRPELPSSTSPSPSSNPVPPLNASLDFSPPSISLNNSTLSLPSESTNTTSLKVPEPALSVDSTSSNLSRTHPITALPNAITSSSSLATVTEVGSPSHSTDSSSSYDPTHQSAAVNATDLNDRDGAASIYPVSEPPEYFDTEKFSSVVYQKLVYKVRQRFLFPVAIWIPGLFILVFIGTSRGGGISTPITISVFVLFGIAFVSTYFIYRSKIRRLDAMYAAGLLADTPLDELTALVFQNRVLNPAPLYDADAMRWDEPLPHYGRRGQNPGRPNPFERESVPINGSPTPVEVHSSELEVVHSDTSAHRLRGSNGEVEEGADGGVPALTISTSQNGFVSIARRHEPSETDDESSQPFNDSVSTNELRTRSSSISSFHTHDGTQVSSAPSITPQNRSNMLLYGSPSQSSLSSIPRGRSPSLFGMVRRSSSSANLGPGYPPVILPPNHVAYMQQQQRDQEQRLQEVSRSGTPSALSETATDSQSTVTLPMSPPRSPLNSRSGSTSPVSSNERRGRRRIRLSGTPTRPRSPGRGVVIEGEMAYTVQVEEGERNISIVELPNKPVYRNLVDDVIALTSGPVRIGEARIDESRFEQVRREQMRAQMRESFVLQEILERREANRRAASRQNAAEAAPARYMPSASHVVSPPVADSLRLPSVSTSSAAASSSAEETSSDQRGLEAVPEETVTEEGTRHRN